MIDVAELQRLADAKAVVLLTFTGGECMVDAGVLPRSREVLVTFDLFRADSLGTSVRTRLPDGTFCTFWTDGTGCYHPVIKSIRGHATEATVA